jgi:hypothetical protein
MKIHIAICLCPYKLKQNPLQLLAKKELKEVKAQPIFRSILQLQRKKVAREDIRIAYSIIQAFNMIPFDKTHQEEVFLLLVWKRTLAIINQGYQN